MSDLSVQEHIHSLVFHFEFFLLHSDVVTHVVSEDCERPSLWTWLKGCALKNLTNMHVLDISWFTDSMREGKPVAVETRHLIQVCDCHKPHTHTHKCLDKREGNLSDRQDVFHDWK